METKMGQLIKLAIPVIAFFIAQVAAGQPTLKDQIKLNNVETRHLMAYMDNGHLYTGFKVRTTPDKNRMITKHKNDNKAMRKRIRRYNKNRKVFYGLK
jgi:hypothetical protein